MFVFDGELSLWLILLYINWLMLPKEDLYFHGIKALILNATWKVLLLQVNKNQLKNRAGDPYWDLPWGRVDRGANIEDTLHREVFEETGIKHIEIIWVVGTVLATIRIPYDNSDYGLFLSIYRCEIDHDPIILLSDEHSQSGRFELSVAKQLLSVKYPNTFLDLLDTISPR